MSLGFSIGTVGHFGWAVKNPRKSADWYVENLGLREAFTFDRGVAVESDGVTITLFKGTPVPATIGHVSFHLKSVRALRSALTHLTKNGIAVEDPGEEIGPEAPGRTSAFGCTIRTVIVSNSTFRAAPPSSRRNPRRKITMRSPTITFASQYWDPSKLHSMT
jgi:catechol 2,3-dioxygenase-like lactoylglutathione lyase family enzyme